MKILYIVIGKLNRTDSGSGVRPNSMYAAFLERGHTVYAVSGYQARKEAKLRKAEIEKAKAWVEENNPDLCYIESSTNPMVHACDYAFIRYLVRKKIPTSYFYRDIHHILPDGIREPRKGLANRARGLYLKLMQRCNDRILHKMDIVYFPAHRFTPFFDYKHMELLPPAGDMKFPSEHPNHKTCIYVGGLSDIYGFSTMRDAFRILNRDGLKYRLILVCREEEYRKASGGEDAPEWMEVYHVSGKDLDPLYARADVGLLSMTDRPYSHICICIKLFQYASYGLPIVSTRVDTMGQIILENGFGVLSENNPESFANAIRELLDDDEKLKAFRPVIRKNLEEKHLWVHRVDKIVEDLTGVTQS